ncbi:MAG TPA: nitroreductase family protein [Acidimicrobiales bacterium]|nr:nitroreductase family protein [Acidimicrobiales bacterium]
MDLRELLARRRMVRSFDGTPVDPMWLHELCAEALRSPTAGNSAGVRFHTIGAALVGEYFNVATDESWRAHARRAEGLQRAGAVVLVTSRRSEYVARYAEADKLNSGLDDESNWPIPYWHTDAAMATMALLLLIEESGWQAALWGNFRHEDDILRWARIEDEDLFATVLIGRADGKDVASPSLARDVPSRESRVREVEP